MTRQQALLRQTERDRRSLNDLRSRTYFVGKDGIMLLIADCATHFIQSEHADSDQASELRINARQNLGDAVALWLQYTGGTT